MARHARHDKLDWFDMTSTSGTTRNLVCCVICINLLYVSYSLIYWSIHLFNLFHLMEQIGIVYVRALKTTKLYRRTLQLVRRLP